MRTDQYYYNVERAHEQPNIEREKLEEQVKKFLAKGGKINHVPRGVSKLGAITDHESKKKLEKLKNFGDE